MDSQRLLADYTQSGSDAAFRELVARYLDLVYSTALRLVEGDRGKAEDVAQNVFVDLARRAQTFSPKTQLGGWLHRHTCFVAAKAMRGERRRQIRERQAVEMSAILDTSAADFSWAGPILDEVINELGEADRTAILLRFYEQQDFNSAGEAIGCDENAARMRVARALEKLRRRLLRRGITTSAAALSAALSAQAVHAAPAGLAAAISNAAVLTSTPISTTTTATTKALAMTTMQKTAIAAGAILLLGISTVVTNKKMTARAPVENPVAVDLESYVGRFEMIGHRLEIQRKDPGIAVFIDGKPAFVAYPESAETCVSHDHNSLTELTFAKDVQGRATGLTLVRDGRKLGDLKRIESP